MNRGDFFSKLKRVFKIAFLVNIILQIPLLGGVPGALRAHDFNDGKTAGLCGQANDDCGDCDCGDCRGDCDCDCDCDCPSDCGENW